MRPGDKLHETISTRKDVPGHAPLSLRGNFSWTLVGNTVYAACQWGMLALVARLSTPGAVGRLALGFAVTAPVFMFTGLQLRAVQATDARIDYGFGDYLALRLASIVAAMVAVVGIAAGFGYSRETSAVMVVIGVAKAVESVSDVFYGLLQQHERMDRIAASVMFRASLGLGAFAVGLWLTGSLAWGVLGMAATWAAVLAAYDVRSGLLITRAAAELRPRWDLHVLRRLTLLSLPLGFVMLLVSLNTNIPRYAIERYLGEADLGIFAAVAALLVAGNTVVSALGQSASPRLAKHYAASDRSAFCSLLGKLLVIGAVMGAAGIGAALAIGQPLLNMLYGSIYAGHAGLLTWVAAAAAVSYLQSFSGYAVTAARYFGPQAPLLAIVSGATALGCLWLVPSLGLVGAALALAGASAVHFAGNLVLLGHALMRIRPAEAKPALEQI